MSQTKNPSSRWSPAEYIDTLASLESWVAESAQATVIAFDTESNSLHRYRERVCLIQASTATRDVIIDPIAIENLSALGQLFARADIVKVFHDAVYDLICLRRDFDFEVVNLFDTMLASRMLGVREFGLANILRARFQVEPDKRWQRSDWSRRPLSPEQLAYAQLDTHFLIELRDMLMADLVSIGRLEWHSEDCERLARNIPKTEPRRSTGGDEGVWRLKGFKKLNPIERGRALALFRAREEIAERLDRPTFKVFNDDVIMSLAEAPPEPGAPLSTRVGLGAGGLERFGGHIRRALAAARPMTDLQPPDDVGGRKRRAGRFADTVLKERYEALRKVRIERAELLGIDPELVLSNAALEELARERPTSPERALALRPEFGGWRRSFVLPEILASLTAEPGGTDSNALGSDRS